LAPFSAGAHDFWIRVEPPAPATGSLARVVVAGGHYFPSSSIVLQDRLIHSMQVLQPDGVVSELATQPRAKHREGMLAVGDEGLYLLTLVIKKPQLPQPEYWVRSICTVGPSIAVRYTPAASGLEIVPLGDLGEFRQGANLRIELRQDGVATDGKLAVMAERSGTSWLTVRSSDPAELTLHKSGIYLLAFTKGNQSCSLTFHVLPP
jgi:hypothetical protein